MRLRKNEFDKKKLLVAELGDRNNYEQFKKGTEELLADLEALPYRDIFYYNETHTLNLAFYDHIETSKEKGNMSNLKSAIENLDYYYLLQRQRMEFTIKTHERLLGSDWAQSGFVP